MLGLDDAPWLSHFSLVSGQVKHLLTNNYRIKLAKQTLYYWRRLIARSLCAALLILIIQESISNWHYYNNLNLSFSASIFSDISNVVIICYLLIKSIALMQWDLLHHVTDSEVFVCNKNPTAILDPVLKGPTTVIRAVSCLKWRPFFVFLSVRAEPH